MGRAEIGDYYFNNLSVRWVIVWTCVVLGKVMRNSQIQAIFKGRIDGFTDGLNGLLEKRTQDDFIF